MVRRCTIAFAMSVLFSSFPVEVTAQRTDNEALQRAIAAYDEGELQEALRLLSAAPALLGRHDSAIRSLYTGLVRFALGEPDRARESFSQAVRVEPSMRLDPAVHSPARIAAFDAARAGVAEEMRLAARGADDEGDESSALEAWRRLLEAAPEDAEATGRIAAIEEARRREALRLQEELLAEARSADTLVAEPPVVENAVGRDAGTSGRHYSPGQALAMGLVVPGLGQFYTGRTNRGLLALGAAGGLIAVGLLTERVEIDCASVPVNDVCPVGDVLDERTRRPYLGPAVAAAVGVGLIGAIDAFLTARGANDAAQSSTSPSEGPRLVLPAVGLDANGRLRAELLRVRFR